VSGLLASCHCTQTHLRRSEAFGALSPICLLSSTHTEDNTRLLSRKGTWIHMIFISKCSDRQLIIIQDPVFSAASKQAGVVSQKKKSKGMSAHSTEAAAGRVVVYDFFLSQNTNISPPPHCFQMLDQNAIPRFHCQSETRF
jgi:hypothetical protein